MGAKHHDGGVNVVVRLYVAVMRAETVGELAVALATDCEFEDAPGAQLIVGEVIMREEGALRLEDEIWSNWAKQEPKSPSSRQVFNCAADHFNPSQMPRQGCRILDTNGVRLDCYNTHGWLSTACCNFGKLSSHANASHRHPTALHFIIREGRSSDKSSLKLKTYIVFLSTASHQ